MSGKDCATSDTVGLVGLMLKMLLILFCLGTHVWWLLDTGLAVTRLPLYALGMALLAAVHRVVGQRYYFHWHHWAAGLMLSPLAHTHSLAWTLLLQGLCTGNFIEGAARWSCAPLWHLRGH
jgi:hypothetical protein